MLILLSPFPHQEDPRMRIVLAYMFSVFGLHAKVCLSTSSPARFSAWPDEVMSLALGSS